jgi:hypothetical protein
MQLACDHAQDDPDPSRSNVHRKLKARAALAGMSLSEYLLAEARRSLERPTRGEILERIARRRPVNPRTPAAEVLRAERDRR